ncbi:MAG TPA: trypsin-like peptidase domain-containing protein [Anaerolineae bacterium]|nr:trypsin-like peptidase domain-containing protein [Anaerolineae bacterium]
MALENLQAFSDELAAIVAKVTRSVVRVEARERVAGTGVVWTSGGAIVTADHVVEREENIRVVFNGSTYDAELAGRDPTTDLAVLKVKASDLVPAQVADSKTLKQGNLVFAVGRPWGDEAIVSSGIVSALGRFGRGWGNQFREGLIHTDLTLYPGFSGGPLANASGQIVGINSSVLGRDLALAIPTETVSRIAEQLLSEGKIKRGYLGVGVQKIPLQASLANKLGLQQETGLMVLMVEAGTNAEKAGLLPGDILVGLNGTTIARVRELNRWLANETGGRQVNAKVIRGGELKELPITVGVR